MKLLRKILLLITLTGVKTFSEPVQPPLATFDVHVHIGVLEPLSGGSHLQDYLKRGIADHIALISPSYQLRSDDEYMNSLAMGTRADQATSAIVANDLSHFVGLCGFSWHFPGALSLLKRCLTLPGMSGIKVRFFMDQNFSVLDLKNRLSDVLVNAKSVRWILVHMPHSFSDLERGEVAPEDLENLYELLKLVRRFPNVQWVVAHSFYSPRLVEKAAVAQLPNLWIDISTALTNLMPSGKEAEDARRIQFVDAWRSFGLNHVLFGSDASLDANPNTVKAGHPFEFEGFSRIETANDLLLKLPLSAEELKLILRDNGDKFWNLIHSSVDSNPKN